MAGACPALKVASAGKSAGLERDGPVSDAVALRVAYPSVEAEPCKPDAAQSAAQSFVVRALAGAKAEPAQMVFVHQAVFRRSAVVAG